MNSIQFPAEPTPAWLSMVLRQNGILEAGEVKQVKLENTDAFNSQTIRLTLIYSPDAPDTAPEHLILKRNTQESWAIQAGKDEVRFYQFASETEALSDLVPPCYAAGFDETSGNSFLLLKDLSETHKPPITRQDQISIIRGVPQAVYQESVIDTLARIHAFWWDHPKMASSVFQIGFWSRNEQRFAEYLARRQNSWKVLMAKESSWFPKELETFFLRIFDTLPAFWEMYIAPRFSKRKNLTLTHGDSYFANFLCPKVPFSNPTYLIDWQSPTWDLAGYDLVNLLATFWTRTQRQAGQLELNLLQSYHAKLLANCVQDYTWDNLLSDYQAGLVAWVLMPVQDGADGAPKTYWWPKMQCLVDAFNDWHCMNLLESCLAS